MTQDTMQTSGTSKPPKLLAAPRPIPIASAAEIRGIFCYIVRHYGGDGVSVLVHRKLAVKDVDVTVTIGDWSGDRYDLGQPGPHVAVARELMAAHVGKISQAMKLMAIAQAQFYFARINGNYLLVDIQTALHKLCGPGMVRDVFGKIIPTQEVIKIETLDDRALNAIYDGFGSYAGDLIIKPSKFRSVERLDGTRPLYVEVKR